MKKTAVILFNLGGPDKISSVKRFLFNLFYDKAIIDLPNPWRYFLAKFISGRRNKVACEIYKNIGGKSPILEINNQQADNLEKILSFFGDFKVFVCMRYWHPMSKEVVSRLKEYGADEIIMLPLYPQFSSVTTKSSFEDFEKEIKKQKLSAKIKKICCYPTNSKFIQAHCSLIMETIGKAKVDGNKKYRLLFSAHGIPQKIIDKGDPYVFQIKQSVQEIISEIKIANLDYQICYQSKVGKLKWTTPSLDDELNRVAKDKIGVIIIPIAFTSDHSETLVELDIEYKKIAEEKTIPFYYRVKALNHNESFMQSLAQICKNVNQEIGFCSNDKGERICPKNFKQCISS